MEMKESGIPLGKLLKEQICNHVHAFVSQKTCLKAFNIDNPFPWVFERGDKHVKFQHLLQPWRMHDYEIKFNHGYEIKQQNYTILKRLRKSNFKIFFNQGEGMTMI